ncbi:MAG: LacI family DNA-binding transcriptional regulator [Phycisphaerae bacterium]|nr:LacI family DNA-binding transcriptional regulator [Phycisphaerae bacterium]
MPRKDIKPAVRLQDIAQEAGVSCATVSYALCGTRGVSTDTRKRILRIANRLGYIPNRQAAALRARRSMILGFLVTDIKNPFFAEIVCGIESTAAAKGYRLMLCVTGDDPSDEARHLQMLLEHGVDGLILVPIARSQDGTYPNTSLLRAFQRRRTPVISIVDSIKDYPTARITTSVYEGTRLVAEHLIALGHRRIAYLSQPFHRIQKFGRHAAYHDALNHAGIPFDPELMVEAGLTPNDAYEKTGQLLDSGIRFTAAMYPNDYMAVGGLRMLRERSLRVPDAVSVTGFDDVEWARFCEVPLTTARFPARALGEMAVRELTERLSRHAPPEDEAFCQISVSPTLIVRRSTGPVAGELGV